ncbi:pancreatic secretory granule membrane major glycoprotein GP2-like [Discoglossus pictus]
MKLLCVLVGVSLLKHAGAACYSGTKYPLCSSCGGSCSFENECACSDGLSSCLPQNCDPNHLICCPQDLFWDDEKSCCSADVVCSPPCLSDEICVNITNEATCVCNDSSHTGAKIEDLVQPVNCDGGTMTISVGRCLLNALGYDYTSLKVYNNSDICSATFSNIINNQRVQSLQLIAQTGYCGNVMMIDAFKVNYTNTLHIDILNRSIIAKNPMEINFTCSYNLTMETNLSIALHPQLGTTYLTAPNGEGSYPLTMTAYKDSAFSQPFQPTDSALVGSDIFLGLIISDADGMTFALRVVKCWATPTKNPEDPNYVLLVSGGCQADGGVETEVMNNGNGLEARIRFSSFLFQGFEEVFVFCDARLCGKSENCYACQNGRAAESNTGEVMIALNLEDNGIYFSSSASQKAVSWTVLTGSFLAIIYTKFL